MTAARIRPTVHFTVPQGWMNDPHGIHWDGTQWHLFFQWYPDAVRWTAPIRWGRAVSNDLISWQHVGSAFEPLAEEIGCWSGSVVVDGDVPWLFYTRPQAEDWRRGQVIRMRGTADRAHWIHAPVEPLVVQPTEREFFDFRDPQIRHDADGWHMVLGAGIAGVGGCAVQYSSTDLEHWSYDGVIAERSLDETEGAQTGRVWECPQIFAVGDRWVLLVSGILTDDFQHTCYAVGDFDGTTFTPVAWGLYDLAECAYASSWFTDNSGRPTVMSWLRDSSDKAEARGSAWCGAQSIPTVLSLNGTQLVHAFHEGLNAHCSDAVEVVDAVYVGTSAVRVQATVSGVFSITSPDLGFTVTVDAAAGSITLKRDEKLDSMMTVPAGAGTFDLVVDADIIEWTWSNGGMASFFVDTARPQYSLDIHGRAVVSRLG